MEAETLNVKISWTHTVNKSPFTVFSDSEYGGLLQENILCRK